MRIAAASCTAVHYVVAGPRRRADWLGACRTALYLQVPSGEVLAILTRDAVQLPCAVVVPRRSGELPLDQLVATARAVPIVGGGEICWGGPAAATTVVAVAQWRPPAVATGAPDPAAVVRLAAALREREVVVDLDRDAEPEPGELLGRGPGLTPSGDDVLAGYLIGARAFGIPRDRLAAEIERQAARRTTALSAQLLRHAIDGACAPQLARLVTACITGQDVAAAAAAVVSIGSSSGAALAAGVLVAARLAVIGDGTEAAA